MSNKQGRPAKTGLRREEPVEGAEKLFGGTEVMSPVQTEEKEAVEPKSQPKRKRKPKPKKAEPGVEGRRKTSFYILKEVHDLLQYMQALSVLDGEKQTIGNIVEEAVRLYAKRHKIELPENFVGS